MIMIIIIIIEMYVYIYTEDVLGTGGSDDDFGTHRSDTNLEAGVTVLSQLSHEHFVYLRLKHSVSDELLQIKELFNTK